MMSPFNSTLWSKVMLFEVEFYSRSNEVLALKSVQDMIILEQYDLVKSLVSVLALLFRILFVSSSYPRSCSRKVPLSRPCPQAIA
jgi:hypothetical protein